MIEKTLALVKPDGVQRALVGKVIERFENTGLKIIAMKMQWIDKKFAETHYSDIGERYGKRILANLVNYITEGPVVAMVLEGVQAVKIVRKLVGSTYPDEALPGTIRGDFAHICKLHANKHDKKVGNLIHTSATQKEAKTEVALWFKPKEMHSYETVHEKHVI